MTVHENDIDVLNSLIETVIDTADGYTHAIDGAETLRFGAVFARRGAERHRLRRRLQSQVRDLGGTPERDGTIPASAYRVFANLHRFAAEGDTAVLDTVEAGETFIKAKFEDALDDSAISAATKALIAEAYAVVKNGHDEIRDLRQAVDGGDR